MHKTKKDGGLLRNGKAWLHFSVDDDIIPCACAGDAQHHFVFMYMQTCPSNASAHAKKVTELCAYIESSAEKFLNDSV